MFDKEEKKYDIKIPPKSIVVIRADGKSFSKMLRPFRPYDQEHSEAMIIAAIETCKIMMNVMFCYVQSDEVSFVLCDDFGDAQPWFDNRLQKLVSVSASSVASNYSVLMTHYKKQPMIASFDAKAFSVDSIKELVKYIRLRITNSVNNSTVSLYKYSIGNPERKPLSALSSAIASNDIEVPDTFRHGTLLVNYNRSWTRLSPANIKSELSPFIFNLFEKKHVEKVEKVF